MADVIIYLFNVSITAGYMILAVLLLRVLLNKAPKRIRTVLWAFVGIRLVLPFSVESVFSLIPSKETISSFAVNYSAAPSISSGISVIDNTVNNVIGGVLSPEPGASVNPLRVIAEIAGISWAVGFALMLLYAAVSIIKIKHRVREAVTVKDNIRACDYVESPFIFGIFKPKIYIPSDIDIDAANLIISHEKAHIKRGDHFWKPFGFLLLCVYWFNPLCWLAYILLCRDIELACDEKVVGQLDRGDRADYSEALLRFASPARSVTACPVAFGEVGVKERVKAVLNYKKPSFWIVAVSVVLCAATAVCLLTDPYSGSRISDKLQVTLDTAIAENNKSEDSGISFSVCAYDVMGTKKSGKKTTVYALVLYEEYCMENGVLERRSHSLSPAAVTADTSDNGDTSSYDVEEYWTPRDGIYFADDIKEKFPERFWSDALELKGSDELAAECLEQAREYFAINNPAEMMGYSHNSDGTYTAENGLTYSYKLYLTGRSPNASVDSWFTVLSNDESLSFERVNESLFTSSTERFLRAEDAVIIAMGTVQAQAVHAPEPDTVSLAVTQFDRASDSPSITVLWKNSGDEEFAFGLSYCVYRIDGGRAERMAGNDKVMTDAVLYALKENGSMPVKYDLSMFDFSDGGTYRIYLGSFEPSEYWVDFSFDGDYYPSDE